MNRQIILVKSEKHSILLDFYFVLDMETIEALAEAIKKFQGGVVLVSHDELLIKRICTEAWLCRNGSVTSLEYGFEQYKKLIESELQY